MPDTCRIGSLQATCVKFLATNEKSPLLSADVVSLRGGCLPSSALPQLWDQAEANSSRGLDSVGARVILNLLENIPSLASQLCQQTGGPIHMAHCCHIDIMQAFARSQIVPSTETIKLDFSKSVDLSDSCVMALLCSERISLLRIASLRFSECNSITDSSFSFVQNLSETLEELDFKGCQFLTDQSISSVLQNCRQLMYLDLSKTCASNTSVRIAMERCWNMQFLTLESGFITDSILPTSPHPRLRSLIINRNDDFVEAKISDRFLELIPASFPMLEKLEICDGHFTIPVILKTVQSLTHLEVCCFPTFADLKLHISLLARNTTTLKIDGTWNDEGTLDLQYIPCGHLAQLLCVNIKNITVLNLECLSLCRRASTLKLYSVTGSEKSPLSLMQSIAQSVQGITKLSLGGCCMAYADSQLLLDLLPSLKEITLGVTCTGTGRPFFFTHQCVENIDITLKPTRARDVAPVVQFLCSRLTTLKFLFIVKVTSHVLQTIVGLLPVNLSCLLLSGYNMPKTTISLRRLTSLKRFEAPFSVNCYDYSALHIPGTLEFEEKDITTFPLDSVANLHTLHLFNAPVRETEIQALGKMLFLRDLDITNNCILKSFILSHPTLHHIRLLHVNEAEVFMLDCPQLISLDIDGCAKIANQVAGNIVHYNTPNLRYLRCIMTTSFEFDGNEYKSWHLPPETFSINALPTNLISLELMNTIRILPEIRLTNPNYKIGCLTLCGCYMLETITIALPHLYDFNVRRCPRLRDITILASGEIVRMGICQVQENFTLNLGEDVSCLRVLDFQNPFVFTPEFVAHLTSHPTLALSLEYLEIPRPPETMDLQSWFRNISGVCPLAKIHVNTTAKFPHASATTAATAVATTTSDATSKAKHVSVIAAATNAVPSRDFAAAVAHSAATGHVDTTTAAPAAKPVGPPPSVSSVYGRPTMNYRRAPQLQQIAATNGSALMSVRLVNNASPATIPSGLCMPSPSNSSAFQQKFSQFSQMTQMRQLQQQQTPAATPTNTTPVRVHSTPTASSAPIAIPKKKEPAKPGYPTTSRPASHPPNPPTKSSTPTLAPLKMSAKEVKTFDSVWLKLIKKLENTVTTEFWPILTEIGRQENHQLNEPMLANLEDCKKKILAIPKLGTVGAAPTVLDCVSSCTEKTVEDFLKLYKDLRSAGTWLDDSIFEYTMEQLHATLWPKYCREYVDEDHKHNTKIRSLPEITPAHLGVAQKFWLFDPDKGEMSADNSYASAIEGMDMALFSQE
ncbi:hypothetical protein Pelo_11214 [Pelomyxa schiedti]|nr:hypothetical protein Pelo_11214 [Pelomyxa schiedti]